MVKSLLSRLFGKKSNVADTLPTPDISRVTGTAAPTPRPASTPKTPEQPVQTETIDIQAWMTADINHLCETWSELFEAPQDSIARTSFERAIHNLYGASGAYGGGPLTRLSGSLQKLVKHANDIEADAALINLHVQACRASTIGSEAAGKEIADAVCEKLEAQVDAKTKRMRK